MHGSTRQEDSLPPRTVDIWLTDLADVNDSLREAYTALLNPSELMRLNRFLAPDASNQFLVARALLRTVLSRYADIPPHAWAFETNEHGKPRIVFPRECNDLQFNLSHTKGLVACAVSRDYPIGVDVEYTHRDFDHLISDSGIFALTEIARLKQLSLSDRRQHFYSLWTLKEAYVKARGMGLSIPLDAFWFEFDGSMARVEFSDRCIDQSANWQFVSGEPTRDHKLALAVHTAPNVQVSHELHWTIPLA